MKKSMSYSVRVYKKALFYVYKSYVELNTYKMCSKFDEMAAAKFRYICDYVM